MLRGAWCVVRGAQFLCRSEARRSKDTFVGRGRYGTKSEGHRYIWYGTLLRRCAQLKHSIVEQLYRWVLYLKTNKQTTTRNTHKHKYTHQRPRGPALQHRKTHTPHSRLHGARLIHNAYHSNDAVISYSSCQTETLATTLHSNNGQNHNNEAGIIHHLFIRFE